MGLMDAYCSQVVTWLPQVAPDQYGQVKGSTGVQLRVRFESRIDLIANASGDQVVSSGRIFAPPGTTSLQAGDQIQTSTGRKYRIIRVDAGQGLNSQVWVCAYLGG